MKTEDFSQYYDLEKCLFEVVSKRFAEQGTLTAFDFFCIVIWKANRAKSRVADRLLHHGKGYASLEAAVADLLFGIAQAETPKTRLSVLMQGWGFRLPMASAILTVLYPRDFTVYDIRVCEVLGDFKDAQYKADFNALWERYSDYLEEVKRRVPQYRELRDKDRYLWGQSFANQLKRNIANAFGGDNVEASEDLET